MRETLLRTTFKRFPATLALMVPFLLWSPFVRTASADVQIQTFKTHGRLIVGIDDGVPVEWKNSRNGFVLFLKGIGLADLGAPLGEESQWLSKFRSITEPNLASMKISESAAGVRIEGRWKYATGRNAPADPQMEVFEFRDKTPQYVVDFWPKKGPTAREVQALRAQAEKLAAMNRTRELSKKRADRRIANEKLRAESDDVASFCREPLSDRTDVFLPFMPYHEHVDFSRWIPVHTPDENFTYFRPQGKDKESQYVRLALELYRQGKNALVLKTLDFYEAEFPNSEHRTEMRFLRANALIKLGVPRDADTILNRIVLDAKDSPVAVFASMYIAGHQIESGSPLAALESFLWLIQHYPSHRLAWVFHLGAAESLFSLKQTERAAKEYEWIVENGPSRRAKAQAALRMGDLYLERFHYEQALAAYYQGLNRFGQEAKEFPPVFVNRGEALYQLGQLDRAQEVFQSFLKAYPSHPSGWRAAFRLGEIAGRKAGPEAFETSRKWYYETINSYPTSPGATLARLRLVSCGDHGGFDVSALDQFMSTDAEKFDGRGEVSVKRYRDFRDLAYVRALITLGKQERAVTLAMQELQANPVSEIKQFLRKIIGSLFRRSILAMLSEGKKYDALAFYQEKKDMIVRELPTFQLDYLLKLSQAASDLGLGSMAQELVATYEKARDPERVHATGRTVASEPDADPEFEARADEQSFSKAKALWASPDGPSKKAEIRTLLAKVSERSRFAFEREVILGVMDEQEQRLASALNHAVKAQMLEPAGLNKTDLALESWLASLEAKAGDPHAAYEMYSNLEKANVGSKPSTLEGLGVPAYPADKETIWLAQGELLEKMARWNEAAAAYGKLVEKNLGGNRARFSYAKCLIKSGLGSNEAKGRTAMRKLASSTPGDKAESKDDDFWKRLANEMLANETAKEGGK